MVTCRSKWRTDLDGGVDGLVADATHLYAVSPELVQAFDRSNGLPLWSTAIDDDTGDGTLRGGVVNDALLIAPEYGTLRALSRSDGSPIEVSAIDRDSLPVIDRSATEMPPSYSYDGGRLRRQGHVLWQGGSGTSIGLGLPVRGLG